MVACACTGVESHVVEAAAPDGVTAAGEKLHVVPTGKPEQLNDTDELNPLNGVTEIVLVPLCPGTTVSDAGTTVIEKSGVGRIFIGTDIDGCVPQARIPVEVGGQTDVAGGKICEDAGIS
jgi:hypothetical protein